MAIFNNARMSKRITHLEILICQKKKNVAKFENRKEVIYRGKTQKIKKRLKIFIQRNCAKWMCLNV